MKEELIRKLSSEDRAEVRDAIEALANYEDPEVIRAVVDAVLSRRSRAVLEAAKETLMSFTKERETVCREVLRLLETPEPKLRQSAVDILSSAGETCLPLVEEKLLNHPDYNMRKFALDILARIKTGKALELTARLLEDENPNVSMTALEYLQNFAHLRDRVVPLILRVIPRIRDLYGLTTLASTVIYGNLKDQRLLEPLRRKLSELKDPLERYWIYKILIFLGDRSVIEEAVKNARSAGVEEDVRKDIEIFLTDPES